MKRVLTTAVVGGLLIFAVPQAAFADDAGRQGGECPEYTQQAAEPAPDCAAQPEGTHDADGHRAPDGSGRRENHDGDDGTILF